MNVGICWTRSRRNARVTPERRDGGWKAEQGGEIVEIISLNYN